MKGKKKEVASQIANAMTSQKICGSQKKLKKQ